MLLPRGCGKTTLLAAFALWHLLTNQIRGEFDDAFNAGDVFVAGPDGGSPSDRIYNIVYSASSGKNVTAQLATENSIGAANDCIVSGTAIG